MLRKQKRKSGQVWMYRLLLPEGKLREAMELYPGKMRQEVQQILCRELRKRLVPGLLASVLLLVLAVLYGSGEENPEGIMRPAPGNPPITKQVLLNTTEEQRRISLVVGAKEYEEAQIEEMHQNAEAYLEQVVPGENEDFSKVTKALVFPGTIPDINGSIYWSTDAPWLITAEGEVLNAELTETEQVRITAELSYGSETRYFSRVATVYPAEYTEEEKLRRAVQQELKRLEEESRTAECFVLPQTILGYPVEQEPERKWGAPAFLLLVAVILPFLLYSGYFGEIDTKRKKRKDQAEECYTEFVTKLSLMLAAGMSLRQAFLRLAVEYEENHGPQHVLAAELKVSRQELDNGHSEAVVYEMFGRRMGAMAYRRMSSLLAQNVSRGVQGMRNLLLQEAKEVMAQDRANIKVKGEQAGTKLLGPMMGLLFLVFAILLVPAFQSF